jgi:hypothetical protein
VILILFFALLTTTVVAQKTNVEGQYQESFLYTRKSKSSFVAHRLTTENLDVIQDFLRQYLELTEKKENGITFHYQKNSPSGKHYSFFQTIGGIKVYNSEVKVNTNGNGVVTSIFDNSFSPKILENNEVLFPSLFNLLQKTFEGFELIDQEQIWFPISEETLVKTYRVELRKSASENIEIITNGKEVLHLRDLNTYFLPPDSTAKGFVFLPDPLTTSGNVYGGIYVDNNDADAPWLTNERKQVNLTVDFSNNLFRLKNSFVQIADFDLPTNAPATAASPVFDFTRSNMNFEQVNALYHITETGKRMQQMGFDCANSLVEADANALNGQDNSFFATNYSPMRLYFGIGGVDDAEDADVCVHEYSHFLSYNAAPQSNSGNERLALDEAFGDYNAASYSRWLNDFNWGWVYNWDGHNTFWNGRVVNSTKKYPTNISNNIYRDGEIWSSMLMQLWSDIGKDVMDKLIVQTHYGYAQNIKFTDAANLLLNADQQLFNGVHYCAIAQRMFERGVLPNGKTLCPSAIEETPTTLPIYLVQNHEGCFVTSAETIWNATLEVMDANGKTILTQPFEGKNFVSGNLLAQGIYFVKVHTATQSKTLKWINVK